MPRTQQLAGAVPGAWSRLRTCSVSGRRTSPLGVSARQGEPCATSSPVRRRRRRSCSAACAGGRRRSDGWGWHISPSMPRPRPISSWFSPGCDVSPPIQGRRSPKQPTQDGSGHPTTRPPPDVRPPFCRPVIGAPMPPGRAAGDASASPPSRPGRVSTACVSAGPIRANSAAFLTQASRVLMSRTIFR